jgi:restriction system protein
MDHIVTRSNHIFSAYVRHRVGIGTHSNTRRASVIYNRTAWAKTYLLKAGLLSSPKRGNAVITEKGRAVLAEKPDHVNVAFLERFPEFLEFRAIKKEEDSDIQGAKAPDATDESTPDELMDSGYKSIHANLAQDLLDRLRDVDPYYFENIVGILLTAMGYGRFEPTPASGDDGIDGIVYQDKLGLDKIFFQSKRYKESNTVPAMAVRDFVGTLELHGINKGIFITTSRFPKDTNDILKKTQKSIILVDGPRLASLMIEHDVGVSIEKKYLIKRIDSDFFIED